MILRRLARDGWVDVAFAAGFLWMLGFLVWPSRLSPATGAAYPAFALLLAAVPAAAAGHPRFWPTLRVVVLWEALVMWSIGLWTWWPPLPRDPRVEAGILVVTCVGLAARARHAARGVDSPPREGRWDRASGAP